jgi:hypothetical protein
LFRSVEFNKLKNRTSFVIDCFIAMTTVSIDSNLYRQYGDLKVSQVRYTVVLHTNTSTGFLNGWKLLVTDVDRVASQNLSKVTVFRNFEQCSLA